MKSSDFVLAASLLAIAQPTIAATTATELNQSKTISADIAIATAVSQECEALIFVATHLQRVPKGQSKTGTNIGGWG